MTQSIPKHSYSTPFLLLALALFVLGLFLMNDFLSLWPGAETWSLQGALAGERWYFQDVVLRLAALGGHWQLFWLRLPNVILSLGLGTLTFVWGRKLFGGYRMTTWLMILVSTLLFSNLQKFAS
ncbi:MAG: hypothetical protein KDC44_04185, partial [Phaeodactylibacter sp.]|nr:hypothetical protein [Phaeodactylibacter sp.]